MIPLCLAEGLGVLPWSPLARGLLARSRPSADAPPPSTRAQDDPVQKRLYEGRVDWEVVDAVEEVARERGVGMAEVALAWLLSRPAVTAPIVGATKLSHLESAIRGVELKLTAEEIARLEAPYGAKPVSS